MKPCMFFFQDKCKFTAQTCKFLHIVKPEITDPSVCKFFVTNQCTYGDKCKRDHDKNA